MGRALLPLLFFVPLVIVAGACGAPSGAPRTPVANSRLSVGPEVFVDDGPFRVVFTGPKGDVEQANEITIAFSRPVRAVGTAEEGVPAATVVRVDGGRIVEGTWRWFGERTAVFWPKPDSLSNAAEYEVSILPSLRSFDDQALTPAAPFRFVSQRPALRSADYQWLEGVGRHTITVRFTQKTLDAAVLSSVRIEGKGPKGIVRVPFKIGKNTENTFFELMVDPSIASLEEVNVIADATLKSTEGPLPSAHEHRVPIPEIGPQKVELLCTEPGAKEEKVGAKRCSLESGSVMLRFSKPVRGKDLGRHLSIVNPKPKIEPWTDDTVNDLDLERVLELLPGKKYKLTVKGGLPAHDKERLAADHVFEFETVDYASRLHFRDIDGDAVVESARPEINLNLDTMNVPSFEAVRAPIDERQLFTLLAATTRTTAAIRALPNAVTSTIETNGKKNDSMVASFDLPPAQRAAGAGGLFAVATSAPGVPDDVRILSVTDLGITTKWSPHGGLVWVTRLSNGSPVKDARLAVMRRGSEAYATTTNAEGIATIPAQVAATFIDASERSERGVANAPGSEPTLLVHAERDVAFSRLPSPATHLARASGIIFTERPLYRPGETAFVKGIFRAPSAQGLVPLPGRKVQVEAIDDDDRTIFATTAVLDGFGAFSCEMPIPRNVRLGFARVRARVGTEPLPQTPRRPGRYYSGSDWTAQVRFTIDEFRTVEMKLEAKAERKEYLVGQRAEVTMSGKYLFGTPMHDVPVTVRASRSASSFVPESLRDFSTLGAGLWKQPPSTLVPETEVMLGKDGVARLPIPLALPQQVGPERITVDASIADVSKAFIVGDETSFLVHPAEIYVGVRRAETKVPPWIGTPVRAEVAAAPWEGPKRAGVAVRLELLHRKDPKAEPVTTRRTCNVVTTDTVAGCDFAVTETGTYWITARANDPQGKPVMAATSFDVQKEEPPKPKPPPPPPPTPPKPPVPPPPFDVACKMEKPWGNNQFGTLWVDTSDEKKDYREYKVGEKVHTCLRGNGIALFTQEREGVLAHEIRRIDKWGETRDLPIVPLHHPNVNLALHTVSGRAGGFPTKGRSSYGHPSYTADHYDVRVARPAEKALTVTLLTGEEHRPGEQIETKVRVVDGNGRPTVAQVTFWAVDQGVLELEPFRMPEPENTFGEIRRSDVVTNDSRDRLLWEKFDGHRVKAPSIRMGATSVSPHAHIGRAVFRPTAWFLPALVTKPDGTASAQMKLPDNLTTWKVFAVAATATEGFGHAEVSFVTKKPLIARPALPRFLRVGDRFDAMAVIDSMEKKPLEVKVRMQAKGALAGEGAMTVAVPSEGHVPIRFPVTAPASGNGRISFRADAGGGLSDDVTIEEEVTTPATFETIVLGGETRGRVDEGIGDLSRARSDVGGLDFRIATSPLVGMAESIQGLVEYPYGCTEQLSSRLVPLVRLRTMARELGVTLPKDVDGAVRSSLASLLSHQRSDGGFGFWQESSKSEPWLTIIALSALQTSKDAGFAVPQEPIDRALAWIEKTEGLDGASKAMLEDLFASLGRPRTKELRALASDVDHLPLFARGLLAHALAKVEPTLAQKVLDNMASHVKVTSTIASFSDEADMSWRTHLSSDTRTTAIALRAFVAVDPKNALTAKLARGLLSLRRKGRWPTTQESAWAIVALDDARALYATSSTTNATLRLSLEDTEIARATGTNVASGTIPMAKLLATPGGRLSFTAEGAPLFYEAALRYARKEPPATPLEHGIHVARTLKASRRKGESVPATDLRVGDYIDVDVVLASAVSRDLVVLDDPIPAGFEAVNQSFANSDRFAQRETSWEVTHRELHDDRVVSFFDRLRSGVTHTTYRLRVIASGRFTYPPAKAECMYTPDVFGRTASTTIETR